MKVFSEEWVTAFAELLRKDKEFQEKAKEFNNRVQFQINADKKSGPDQDMVFDILFPACEDFYCGKKPEDETNFIVSGKGGAWIDVFRGKKNPVMALSPGLGSLKLAKGSLLDLTAHLGGLLRFFKVAGPICGGEAKSEEEELI